MDLAEASKNSGMPEISAEQINGSVNTSAAYGFGGRDAIRYSTDALHHIINSMPGGVVVCDPADSGSLVFINDTICKMTEYSKD